MRAFIDIVTEAPEQPLSQLSNPAFVSWFGGSKIVDAAGEPRVCYHGTTKDFDTFKLPGRGEYRAKAIFLAMDPEVANAFTHGVGSLMPCYVRAENPFDYRDPAHLARLGRWLAKDFERKVPGALYTAEAGIRWLAGGDFGLLEQPTVQAWLRRSGFDGFYVTEGRGDLNIAVFTPNQVKSAYNAGAFSRDSDHVSEMSSAPFAFLKSLTEAARPKGFFDPAATYLHGGPPVLTGGALKRYGRDGGDMGGLFFTKDSPEGRAYAVSYTFGKNGVVYTVRINLPADAVFDLTNPRHRVRLQRTVSAQEWTYFVESARGGQLDWAVVDEDLLGEAGFKGAILAERPAGLISDAFVYSVAVFDAGDVAITGQLDPETVKAVAYDLAKRTA